MHTQLQTMHPRSISCCAGLTKMVSRLGKEGAWRKALEIYQNLPQTGVLPDTAITNAAISACDKGVTCKLQFTLARVCLQPVPLSIEQALQSIGRQT